MVNRVMKIVRIAIIAIIVKIVKIVKIVRIKMVIKKRVGNSKTVLSKKNRMKMSVIMEMSIRNSKKEVIQMKRVELGMNSKWWTIMLTY